MFSFFVFFVLFLKFSNFFFFSLSIFFVFLSIVFWFYNILLEGICGFHNFYVQDGLKLGFFFFIFWEVIFFFSVFWFFFDVSLSPLRELGFFWVPFGIIPPFPFGVPLLNSFFLLSWGITLTWSHYCILSLNNGIKGLFFTILLSIFFLLVQFFEYIYSVISISDWSYGTIFFFATGFHGLHVLLGTLFLLVCLLRFFFKDFSFFHYIWFEFSIVYWHFVDVVWLFLFVFVYWWSF
jgi:cytochrome c oxidase subunit 3